VAGRDAGMVACLQQGADVYIAQLLPLPMTDSCFSKIEIGFTVLVPAHPDSPGQKAVKQVSVCVTPSVADLVYVCGGFDGSVRHTSMERYDPTIDQWTMLASMSTGREGAGLVVANDQLYCVGGYDGLSLLNSAERYDPNTAQWTLIASMSTRRSGRFEIRRAYLCTIRQTYLRCFDTVGWVSGRASSPVVACTATSA